MRVCVFTPVLALFRDVFSPILSRRWEHFSSEVERRKLVLPSTKSSSVHDHLSASDVRHSKQNANGENPHQMFNVKTLGGLRGHLQPRWDCSTLRRGKQQTRMFTNNAYIMRTLLHSKQECQLNRLVFFFVRFINFLKMYKKPPGDVGYCCHNTLCVFYFVPPHSSFCLSGGLAMSGGDES